MFTLFQNEWLQDVSGETLPIRIKEKLVLLFHEDPKMGKKHTILSSDPNVLKVEEKKGTASLQPGTRRFEVTALQDAEEVAVSAFVDAGNQVVNSLEYRILNSRELGAIYRGKVIQIARSMIGCHYVMGAAGAVPDQMNGMVGRPGSVFMLPGQKKGNADDLIASTATANVHKKYHTCAGRAWKIGKKDSYVSEDRVAEIQSSQPSGNLTCRTLYKMDVRKGIVLGERCEGIRHFDCVGFINYCLSEALGKNIKYNISGAGDNKNIGYANQMHIITNPDDHLPGDILIYGNKFETLKWKDTNGRPHQKEVMFEADHIAFSLGKGKGRVHASDTEYGVLEDGNQGNFARRVRHPKLL